MTADRLHRRRVAPGAIGLGAGPLLRIKRGILLLHIEVSHRLFSLRWLMPSAHNERRRSSRLRARTRPRNRTLYDESNHRHRGMRTRSRSITQSRSINRNRFCAKTIQPISVNVSVASWARDTFLGQTD